jgi:hypothetical protein
VIPYLYGVDSFLPTPFIELKLPHFIVFWSDARRYGIKPEPGFPCEVFCSGLCIRQVTPSVWIAGLIPSWISLKREKDNFILSFL